MKDGTTPNAIKRIKRRLFWYFPIAAASCYVVATQWMMEGRMDPQKLRGLLVFPLAAFAVAFMLSPWLLERIEPSFGQFGMLLWSGCGIGMMATLWYVLYHMSELLNWLPVLLGAEAGVGLIGQVVLQSTLSLVHRRLDVEEPPENPSEKLGEK